MAHFFKKKKKKHLGMTQYLGKVYFFLRDREFNATAI